MTGNILGALLLIAVMVLVGIAVVQNARRRVKPLNDAFESAMREIAERPRL